MSFELNSIINAGDDYAPPRILVYATHGLGKTTFGASFESPTRRSKSSSRRDIEAALGVAS